MRVDLTGWASLMVYAHYTVSERACGVVIVMHRSMILALTAALFIVLWGYNFYLWRDCEKRGGTWFTRQWTCMRGERI